MRDTDNLSSKEKVRKIFFREIEIIFYNLVKILKCILLRKLTKSPAHVFKNKNLAIFK